MYNVYSVYKCSIPIRAETIELYNFDVYSVYSEYSVCNCSVSIWEKKTKENSVTGQTLPSIFSDSRCESDDEAEKESAACTRRLDHLYASARTVLATLYMKTIK